ncbi:MAG: LysR family transcriptional regulator [Candidatus Omnitrophica bacterium]|nr:LysR family transcriptional regulator [Candidatus Omnitrophota bacterium]MBU0896868.1 LysR family transcriptional regulator [Candidatus Omnitrophota bacterium]MBU1134677.1 LysR family transcriptional regulator [Candidatus Omnitrophota bacterium]MBU1366263.1 LysR family transcriptional regulator [Candidatus Omnitrophota bacterium]MBU1523209.1 LysR family transcriptional regulator [Candidatus Omnitrophota bacterium]
MQIKSKVWLSKNNKLVFGIGKAMILKSIQKAGSINKAARELNMSYRHAWSYIKSAEKRLGKPLVICTKGGVNGGSTTLTPYAKNLLKKFFNLESRVKLFADKVYKETF